MRTLKRLLVVLALALVPAHAAVTRVQVKEAHGSTSPQAVTLDATPTVGNIIILAVETGSISLGLNVIDNQGNGYSRIAATRNGSGNEAAIWCAVAATSSGTFTITASQATNSFSTVFAIEYSGASCNVDKNDGASGATSPYSCGSFTTVNANDLVLTTIVDSGSPTTFTPSSGFTARVTQVNASFVAGSIADNIVTSTATFTPTWTVDANAASACSTTALTAATAAGSTGSVHGSAQ